MPGAPRTNPAAPRGAQADLAARLRHAATGLQDRLNRRDTLVELIRSVNATVDPRKVADALAAQVHGWFPTACLVVAVQDGSQRASLIAERGPCEAFHEGLERVARWITEHNEEFMSASLATDERLTDGPAVTVAGFPLRCRAQTIGALIVLDSAPSSEAPKLPPDVMSALRIVLEGPALALDTTLHLRRVEAAVGDRRSDELVQLAVPESGAAARIEARLP